MPLTVDAFLKSLLPDVRETVDAVRSVISASHPDLTEHIKWNALSFAIDGDDRITLGLERKEGVRLVFHRGAKPKSTADFHFDDAGELLKWLTPDRGIVLFHAIADVESKRPALEDCADDGSTAQGKAWSQAPKNVGHSSGELDRIGKHVLNMRPCTPYTIHVDGKWMLR